MRDTLRISVLEAFTIWSQLCIEYLPGKKEQNLEGLDGIVSIADDEAVYSKNKNDHDKTSITLWPQQLKLILFSTGRNAS